MRLSTLQLLIIVNENTFLNVPQRIIIGLAITCKFFRGTLSSNVFIVGPGNFCFSTSLYDALLIQVFSQDIKIPNRRW